MDNQDVVWQGTLDNIYNVRVVRDQLESHKAILFIILQDMILHSQHVSLSYMAAFGPDVDDVKEWMRIAAEFIDNRGK